MSWCSGYHSCTTLFSKKFESRFWVDSNPTPGESEIWDGKNIWHISYARLEIRLNSFCWSTIPEKQFIIVIINFQCPSSSKLPFFHKNTPQGYFLQPKLGILTNFQYQSFTNIVTQHQNNDCIYHLFLQMGLIVLKTSEPSQ